MLVGSQLDDVTAGVATVSGAAANDHDSRDRNFTATCRLSALMMAGFDSVCWTYAGGCARYIA